MSIVPKGCRYIVRETVWDVREATARLKLGETIPYMVATADFDPMVISKELGHDTEHPAWMDAAIKRGLLVSSGEGVEEHIDPRVWVGFSYEPAGTIERDFISMMDRHEIEFRLLMDEAKRRIEEVARLAKKKAKKKMRKKMEGRV